MSAESRQLRILSRLALLFADIEDGAIELRYARDAAAAARGRHEFVSTDGSTRLTVLVTDGVWGRLFMVVLPNGDTLLESQLAAFGFGDYSPSADTAARAYGLRTT